MKILTAITLLLVVIGGLNWGLVGALDFDLVAALFGDGSVPARLVYILVALSAMWQAKVLVSTFGSGEEAAVRGQSTH